MNIIITIFLYIISIYIFYALIFYKLIFPLKQKNIFVFLNNCEIRWGGWFITHQIEVHFIIWIPYIIKNIPFIDINKYTHPSFEPYKSNLSKKLSFRDCNFSIFNEENYDRLKMYSKNSLDYKPDNFILFNYSFIESIFPNINIRFNNFIFNKKNLFRNLSHITTDNNEWKYDRKNILTKLAKKLIIYISIIPFYPHYILMRIFENKLKKNFYILNDQYKDKPNWNYIWIEENNLIWRKWNRYITNYTQYNFYINELKDNYIHWKWMVKIFKTLFADESFPISWEYKANIQLSCSNRFKYENTPNIIRINNGQSIFYEIPFTFTLPINWSIDIIKWPWTINNNVSIIFQTKMFYLLPNTNLESQVDHLHTSNFELKKDFNLQYNVWFDTSPLKLQSRKIIDNWILSINFNKELINLTPDNFEIIYMWNSLNINKIEKVWEFKTNIYIYYNKDEIEKYDFKSTDNLAYIYCKNLEDKTKTLHYTSPRKIKLVW